MADAPRRLKPGGLLQMVVQRRVPLQHLLAKHLSATEIVTETASYRVWRALRP
jgi:16S rRNA G1207 methylase RsmC